MKSDDQMTDRLREIEKRLSAVESFRDFYPHSMNGEHLVKHAPDDLRFLLDLVKTRDAQLGVAVEALNKSLGVVSNSGIEEIYNWGEPLRAIRSIVQPVLAEIERLEKEVT